MPRAVLHRLFLRNGLYGVGARLATLVVGLFMTPYLLDRLGADRFAVWALASIATGSLGLLDLGVRRALIHRVAATLARAGSGSLSSLLSSALALYAGLACGLAVLALLLVPIAVRLLDIPPSLSGESRAVFGIAALGLVVGTGLAAFPALCDGMQRMDVTNGLGVVWLLAGAAATVLAVEKGHGLRGVAWAQFASISGFFISTAFASRRLSGPLRLAPGRIRRDQVASLLRFGSRVHGGALAALVSRHLDKLLLGRWVGLSSVTAYELGLKLGGNAASLIDYLGAPLLPATSHLAASVRPKDLIRDYERALRFLALVGVPLFAFVVVAAERLTVAWLGPGAPGAASSFARVLAAGYAFAALGGVMSQIGQGLGAANMVLRYALVQLVANVILSIALLAWLGPLGAAAGTALALALSALDVTRQLHRRIEAPEGLIARALGRPLAVAAAAALVAHASGLRLPVPIDRGSALAGVLVESFVFGTVYLLGCGRRFRDLGWGRMVERGS